PAAPRSATPARSQTTPAPPGFPAQMRQSPWEPGRAGQGCGSQGYCTQAPHRPAKLPLSLRFGYPRP
ncbi:MAG: hypothetical protein QXT97_02615, partial [Candidatus Diapherotrites archaeon]